MSYSNYEQTVVLNGHQLLGVQSVEGSYGISEKPVRVAGVGFIDALVDTPLQGNFSINRKMVGPDPLLEKNSLGKYIFDENDINGAIFYDNQNKGFGFTKARISRYSVNCSVGELPDIQTDLIVYGSLGKDVLSGTLYVQNLESKYYPFVTDSQYNVARVYLGGGKSENDVTELWNNGAIKISDEEYNNLEEFTWLRKYPSRRRDQVKFIMLGKDAFQVGSYQDLITQEKLPIKYPDQSTMRVILSDLEIDAVSDFAYSRATSTVPIYALPRGNESDWSQPEGTASVKNLDPVQIDTQYPIETDINLTVIVDDYEMREIKDRIQAAPKSDVRIQIFDSIDGELINEYIGRNVRLISEALSSTVDGEMTISLTYKGYESYHNEFY